MNKFLTGSLLALTIMTNTPYAIAGSTNPLLAPSDAPYGTVRFDLIKPEHFEEAITEAIRVHNDEITAITACAAEPTFENTVAALDRSGQLLQNVELALSNLDIAVGDTVLMNMSAKMTPLISKHYTELTLNKALFDRIRKVYDQRDAIKKKLSPEDMRLLEETYKDFETSGANLQGADRDKYRRLNAELADLMLRFQQNVSNEMASPDRRIWVKDVARLKGLPQSVIDAARAEAKEVLKAEGKEDDGSYLITVFFPSYSPVMKYADDRDLRRELYMLYNSRNFGGEYDNTQILKDIANIRLEIANLLGKKTYAEYTLQSTMAGTPEAVYELLEQLRNAYTEPMRAELKEIEDYARLTEGPDFNLEAWDFSYWRDKLKNDRYAFNDEDMRPYFEIGATVQATFDLANRLYGYTLKPNKDIPVYHPDVTAYEVYDKDGKLMGIFYTDLYYRAGKNPGAWETSFREESIDDNGVKSIPFVSVVCNFSKPVGDEPVLLTPYEASTFLHEFGHSLHALSADTKYRGLSGTSVYRDFVETFSQFNENYLKEKEFLDSFARHYKTGEKMPDELIDRFISSSQFGAAYDCMRQLGFGYLDMAYHTITEPLRASMSVEDFEIKAQDPVRTFPAVEGAVISPSFGHSFSGGYSAGYYGYKWSEVLDADAFAAFKENGIFDPKTAAKFRAMMAAGGTVDPMELYVRFRGHKPTIDALLVRDGIKK